MRVSKENASYFDVPFCIPSSSITTGNSTITTAGADYYGAAVIVSSAPVTVTIYNGTTASGVVVDVLVVSVSTRIMMDTPVKAKLGLSVNVTGTNGSATVFYTPKG